MSGTRGGGFLDVARAAATDASALAYALVCSLLLPRRLLSRSLSRQPESDCAREGESWLQGSLASTIPCSPRCAEGTWCSGITPA